MLTNLNKAKTVSNNKHITDFLRLTKRYAKVYLGVSISIFLFILFFQPFSVDKFEFDNKLIFIAGFGLITFVLMLLAQMLFQPSLLKDEKERVESTIQVPLYFMFLLVNTTLAFIFYIRYVGQSPIYFITVVKALIISSVLPVTFYLKYILNSYQLRLKDRSHENRLLKNELKQLSDNYAEKHIELISDNDGENLRLLVSDLVYIKSADNYVEVGYIDQAVLKKKMLRSTLKNIEQQLVEFNKFTRTHRSSIVNIEYVEKLNKSFNSYWLSLDNTKETIPVSRQYLLTVKDLV